MKINLTPKQTQQIQLQQNVTPIADSAKQFHIGYGRIYEIWRQADPDSIRTKISTRPNTEITSLTQQREKPKPSQGIKKRTYQKNIITVNITFSKSLSSSAA